MMGDSGSKQPAEKRPSDGHPKSTSRGKQSNGSTLQQQPITESQRKQKAPEMHRKESKNRKNNPDQTSSSQQQVPTASTSERSSSDNGTSSPLLSLARRPLRPHFPILVKTERQDSTNSVTIPGNLVIRRDPRQSSHVPNPSTFEENESANLPSPHLTQGSEKVRIVVKEELQSNIDITDHNVKQEPVDPDWKKSYLNEEPSVTPVRIKSEPIDDEAITEDNVSVDSGSTVRRSPSPSRDKDFDEENGMQADPDPVVPTLSVTPALSAIRLEDEDDTQKKSVYSDPIDVADVIRLHMEQESSAQVANNKPSYSQECPDELNEDSDEEIPMAINDEADESNHSNSEENIHSNDDELSEEEFPSWKTPTPPGVEKRQLSDEESTETNKRKKLKKSNFICEKIPLGATTSSVVIEAIPSTSMDSSSPIDEPIPSTSTASSSPIDDAIPSTSTASASTVRESNVETATPQQSTEEVPNAPASKEVTTDNEERTPARPKVKRTAVNRNERMVEDYIKSVNAPLVQKKREIKTLKTPPKRKRPLSGNNSAPSSPSNLSIPNFEGESHVQEPSPATARNSETSLMTIRDPRVRARMGQEASSATSSEPKKRSKLFSERVLPIKRKIIMRVFKWHFKWFEEHQFFNEPPPILQEVKIDSQQDPLPAMLCKHVLGKYLTRQSYFDVFHPLMIHEMWSTLCLQYQKDKSEKKNWEWKILIKSFTKDGNFLLLNCCLVMEKEAEAPMVNDLITITFTRRDNGHLAYPFAIVENSTTTKVVRTADVSQSLLDRGNPPNFMSEITVRILKGSMAKQTNVVYSALKIASLTTSLNLFHVQGAFNSTRLYPVVLDPQPSAFKLIDYDPPSSIAQENLDGPQSKACYSIAQTMLMTSDDIEKVAILQGYPGTGKTHVIVHIIMYLLSHKKDETRMRVLYCAPTNAAVDEMTRRLMSLRNRFQRSNRFNILRLGSWARLHHEVREVTFEDQVTRIRDRVKHENPERKKILAYLEKLNELKTDKEFITSQMDSLEENELQDRIAQVDDEIATTNVELEKAKKSQEESIQEDLQNYKYQIINEADVICTTLDACYTPEMESIFIDKKPDRSGKVARPFLCCIIDDASLCTEPQTLIPLALGMNKLVLVGDIELLPLNLNSSVAKSHKLDQSLFTRFGASLKINDSPDVSKLTLLALTTQHRMDPEICHWPSKYYYGNALITSENIDYRTPLHAYRVLDVRDSLEQQEQVSYINSPEATVVLKLVENIIKSPHTRDRNIGIITFYERQRLYIRHLIKERFPTYCSRIEVKLVEDFQGTEMEIVIISCVKTKISSKDKYLTALTDHWNVAITRATESLFICGHMQFLKKNEVLGELIRDAENRQVIHRVSSLFESSLLYDTVLRPIDY